MSRPIKIRESMMPKSQFAAYPKKFIMEILGIYKNSPCLWKTKSEEYFDRIKKDRAYDIIVEKLQEVERFPDRKMAIALFSALRFHYRKQLKLVEKGKKPTLWYFQHLDFIRNHLYSNRKNDSIEVIINDHKQAEDEFANANSSTQLSSYTFQSNVDISIDSSTTLNDEVFCTSPSHSQSSKSHQHYKDCLIEDVEQPSAQYFDELASTWATILRSTSPQQEIIAEKLVNDIIYEARMKKLTDQLPLDILDILHAQSCI